MLLDIVHNLVHQVTQNILRFCVLFMSLGKILPHFWRIVPKFVVVVVIALAAFNIWSAWVLVRVIQPHSPIPMPMEVIAFEDMEGNKQTLDAFKGKPILLHLWATWCAPCLVEMPALDRMAEALADTPLEVVAIAQEFSGPEKAKQFYAKQEMAHVPFYVDTKQRSMRMLGAKGLPTTILITPDGHGIARIEGAAAWDEQKMMDAVRYFATHGKL